jgi:hypothetical protein
MAGHDNVEASGPRVDVDFLHVMEDVNADSLQLQSEVKRDLRRPCALVVVSPYRVDRRYGAQLFENLGAADVARMDDVLNARERTDRFRAKQSVCIGDEAYRFQWIVQRRSQAAAALGDRTQRPYRPMISALPIEFAFTLEPTCAGVALAGTSSFGTLSA